MADLLQLYKYSKLVPAQLASAAVFTNVQYSTNINFLNTASQNKIILNYSSTYDLKIQFR